MHAIQLTDVHIIQLNIFKYIGSICKKFIPNLSIDEESSLLCKRMLLPGVIYYESEQFYCRHYISGVKVDNNCFLVSDTSVLRQQKLQWSSKDINVPCKLIFKKRSNFLVAPLTQLVGVAVLQEFE